MARDQGLTSRAKLRPIGDAWLDVFPLVVVLVSRYSTTNLMAPWWRLLFPQLEIGKEKPCLRTPLLPATATGRPC